MVLKWCGVHVLGGLDAQVDEPTLQAAFAPFGELVAVMIPADNTTRRHRGFGFVEFEDPVRHPTIMSSHLSASVLL